MVPQADAQDSAEEYVEELAATSLAKRLEKEWALQRPKATRRLKQKGTFRQVIIRSVELYLAALRQCLAAGMNPYEAEEFAMREVLPRPEEGPNQD